MSQLEQIKAFIHVVEENGFASAGRKQGISTAAISRQVAQLESALHVQLLVRSTRRISLTEMGEKYYQYCKQALSLLLEGEAEILYAQAEPRGTLNIVSGRYFANRYLLPHLSEFLTQYPNLKINLELAERFPDFANENIDILFGVSVNGPETLIRRRVMNTRYILCASPQYLQTYGIPKKPLDLVNHAYITHVMRKPDNAIVFKDGHTVYVDPVLRLNDTYAMRECAVQGLGIVKLHDYMVSHELKENKLVEILAAYQELEQIVYLYYQQNRYLQSKIRNFIDFYLQRIS